MSNEDILGSIEELRKGSRLSLGMVALGALFLAGTIYYSAARLAPLEQSVKTMREEIAQLEARRTELLRVAAAVDQAARPVAPGTQPGEGWIYLGRVSASGEWAPQSDRIESPNTPASVSVGSSVKTRQNASLVDNIDVPANDRSAEGRATSSTKIFIKPETQLEIRALREQDSVGGGKLLWASIQVSSDALLQLGQ